MNMHTERFHCQIRSASRVSNDDQIDANTTRASFGIQAVPTRESDEIGVMIFIVRVLTPDQISEQGLELETYLNRW